MLRPYQTPHGRPGAQVDLHGGAEQRSKAMLECESHARGHLCPDSRRDPWRGAATLQEKWPKRKRRRMRGRRKERRQGYLGRKRSHSGPRRVWDS